MSGLCTAGQGSTDVVVKQDATPAQQQRNQRLNQGFPDAPPDFNDNLIQEARKRQAQQLLTRSNRRDALANNPGSAPTVSYSLLR